MRIGYAPVSSELGLEDALKREREIRKHFKEIVDFETELIYEHDKAVEVSKRIIEENIDIVITPVLTGGTEDKILGLAQSNKHILLLTTMYFNSFPAAIEAISKLKREGKKFSVIDMDEYALEKIKRVLEVVKSLHGSKLIMFGDPSPWLVYSLPEKNVIEETLGVKIEKVELSEIISRYQKAEPSTEILNYEKSPRTKEVNEREFEKVGKIHTVLKEIINERRGDFFTIRCFDLIKELGTTPCLSLAEFNNRGTVAGCEGDVPAAISMKIGEMLSNKPTFVANTLKIKDREIILAHCTIATKVVEDYVLRTHFESGKGIGVQGKLKEGAPVTLLKLDPKIEKMYIAKGVIKKGEPFSENLCRTQVTIELDEPARNLIEKPLGNHLIIAFTDITKELELFNQITGIKTMRM